MSSSLDGIFFHAIEDFNDVGYALHGPEIGKMNQQPLFVGGVFDPVGIPSGCECIRRSSQSWNHFDAVLYIEHVERAIAQIL